MHDLNKYLEESIDNIREDRDITKSLLKDVMTYLAGDETRHTQVGQVAAKYVETLQRSNEQLVKIAALLQKKVNSEAAELSDNDKSEIFDLIKESGQNG
jgi:hypothetical protein|tara:strand:+ start:2569 stop:2865 length:297 start_codon:yes stop_codon:yes gene_type:complete